ncbi:MAG: phosphate ABC transporter permease PstA [Candidatus Bipolaricaulota bacterium]|nr:phosphate ABC transporter permease PstA [Candidatus Bipolaricaulota bacterium]
MNAHMMRIDRYRLAWRKTTSTFFGSLTFSAILVSLALLVAIIVFILVNARPLMAMRAASRAGLVLSTMVIQWEARNLPYVIVTDFIPDSAAARAGIAEFDVIIRAESEVVLRSAHVWEVIARLAKETLSIGWISGDSTKIFGDLLPQVDPQTGALRVVIDYLPEESLGARAGLRVGDVLVRIEDIPVTGARQAWEALIIAAQRKPHPSPLSVQIERDGEPLTIALPAEQTAHIPIQRSWWHAIWEFLTSYDSNSPEKAGLASAIVGSFYLVALTALFALPLGVGAAVYLEEYARKNWLNELIQLLIANLAGVPSVIYGIIGLEILARALRMDRVLITGALTMTLLILPMVIIAAREALRAIPDSIRHAAYAVGATRWQVVRAHVLPYALPGILTGLIIALSRAMGEAALLILLGAFQYLTFIPSVWSYFTVIPIQIFTWIGEAKDGFANIAAAAIIVLLTILLAMNGLAIFLRIKFQRRW